MKDEPVAWMRPDTLECGYGGNVDWEDTGCIPLYTHPVKVNYEFNSSQVKKLTDEEILQVYSESEIWVPDRDESDLIEFARAILDRAQEK